SALKPKTDFALRAPATRSVTRRRGAPDNGGHLARRPRAEAGGLSYQRSSFSLNCVDVQPHFLRQSVIQPPFLRWIWHRSLTRTIDQRPSAKSTYCGREHQTARAHRHRAPLRRRDSRRRDEAAVHFSIRQSMFPENQWPDDNDRQERQTVKLM